MSQLPSAVEPALDRAERDLELLGDRWGSWLQLRTALATLASDTAAAQRPSRLMEVSGYALRQGRPHLALRLLDEVILDSVATLRPRTVAECQIRRAHVLTELADHD